MKKATGKTKAAAPKAAKPAAGSYKFLIVDDSLFSRMNLRGIIETNGHSVIAEAQNAEQALAQYQTTHPDIVTMDLNMDQKSGLDAIRDIMKVDPNAHFIIVSAVDQRLVWDQCVGIGVCEYVSKPVSWPKLKEAVARLTKKSPIKS